MEQDINSLPFRSLTFAPHKSLSYEPGLPPLTHLEPHCFLTAISINARTLQPASYNTISNTMSSAVTTTARTILKVPADWIPWLEMVKSTAIIGQI